MTDTTNAAVHPMVMKAMISLCANWNRGGQEDPFESMRIALTECGALGCLEALERLRGEWAYQCSKGNVPEGRVEAEMAEKAIAKVYGSAP
jgi:hypothetical protein